MVQEKFTATAKMDIEVSCGAKRRSEESVHDENVSEQKYKMRAQFSFLVQCKQTRWLPFFAQFILFRQMTRHRSAFLKGRAFGI